MCPNKVWMIIYGYVESWLIPGDIYFFWCPRNNRIFQWFCKMSNGAKLSEYTGSNGTTSSSSRQVIIHDPYMVKLSSIIKLSSMIHAWSSYHPCSMHGQVIIHAPYMVKLSSMIHAWSSYHPWSMHGQVIIHAPYMVTSDIHGNSQVYRLAGVIGSIVPQARLSLPAQHGSHTCRLNSQTLKFTLDAPAHTAIIFSSTVTPVLPPNAQIPIAFCNLGSIRFAVKS